MNETNKFKDYSGDTVQAMDFNGHIAICTNGGVCLTHTQAIEFAKQLTELAQEVKANEPT